MPLLNDFIYVVTGRYVDLFPQQLNQAINVCLLLGLAFFAPGLGRRWLSRADLVIARVAQRRLAAMATVALLAFVINAVISLRGHMPQPGVHDEFSYLLSADTFAHGRAANPTHPMWVHFESFHIIQQPTYASKYPPGQGLVLALGQVLTGYPIVGSWLAAAFACGALCWMLQSWLNPRCAFLGGLLAAVHPTIIDWTQSFWGGCLAMGAGALLLGGLHRVLSGISRSRQKLPGEVPAPVAAGWLTGAGVGILIVTRPYEGGILTMLALALAVVGFWSQRGSAAGKRRSLVYLMSAALLPLLTVIALTQYNRQVTGKPFRLPYAVHEATYGVAPLFVWQPFKPEPRYNHAVLREFHVRTEPPAYLRHRSPAVLAQACLDKIALLGLGYFQLPALMLGILALPWVVARERWMQAAVLVVFVFLTGLMLETWMLPLYASPAAALVFVLTLRGLRQLRLWTWHGRRVGLALARYSVVLSLLSVVSSYSAMARPDSGGLVYNNSSARPFADARARILSKLEAIPGSHLVIVRYAPTHDTGQEWVYNEADIDRARVVWARHMTTAEDGRLRAYFHDRSAWSLDADAKPPRLERLPDGGS